MYTILHTESSQGWGGQEMRILQESLEFKKRGYRMMIACQPASMLRKEAEGKGIPVIVLRMRTAVDPLAVANCIRAIKKNGVDLVHTHSSTDSWCCSMSAKLARVPVIRSRHVTTPISKNCFSRFLFMKLADRVITSGETIRRQMIEGNGYDPRKIISIHAGIDEKRFSPEISGDYVRAELNIEKDDYLLGIVSVLRSWKGHVYLLEAFKALREKIPHLKLLIAGSGPQERNIRKYIEGNGLTGKVIMTGHREDVPQILKSLDLFILPSYSNEATSQVIPQAMAMGIPVISTFAGGIGEVVKDGETGKLVPPRDAPALSEAIFWAYQNREKSREMARKARKSMLKDFTLTGMIDKTESVYRELLDRPEVRR
jgi:glycosyltransferase involved in cell wall biosynthesis